MLGEIEPLDLKKRYNMRSIFAVLSDFQLDLLILHVRCKNWPSIKLNLNPIVSHIIWGSTSVVEISIRNCSIWLNVPRFSCWLKIDCTLALLLTAANRSTYASVIEMRFLITFCFLFNLNETIANLYIKQSV